MEGALPLTEDRVRIMLQEFTRGIENRIDVLMNQAQGLQRNAPIEGHNNNVQVRNNVGSWTWGNRIHPVPNNWKFPSSISVERLWSLWYRGNQSENIGPYKVIQGFDLKPDGHDRINLSRARGVMNHLEGILTRELNIQDINRLGNPQFNNSMVEAYMNPSPKGEA